MGLRATYDLRDSQNNHAEEDEKLHINRLGGLEDGFLVVVVLIC